MEAKFKYKDTVIVGGQNFFRGLMVVLSDFDYNDRTGRWGYIGHVYPTGKPISDLQEDDLTLTEFPVEELNKAQEQELDSEEDDSLDDALNLDGGNIPGSKL